MRGAQRAEGHMSFVLAEEVPGVLTGERQGTALEKSLRGPLLTLVTLFGLFFAAVASGQTFTEFTIPTASSGPLGVAADPDGNLWFAETNGNQIGRITTAGVFTEFVIPTSGSFPYEIASGPDGNLWFTEFGSNKIGRITASGVRAV
jgi:streptogramin lyase